MAETWDGREDGAALLAAATRAIIAERAKAASEGRTPVDADLARAVLRSPAIRDANRKVLDDLLTEYEPKVTALIAAEEARIATLITAAERERLAAVISPERFRQLAAWFDTDDEFKVTMFPETWPHRDREVQDDLRKFADLLGGQERSDEEEPGGH